MSNLGVALRFLASRRNRRLKSRRLGFVLVAFSLALLMILGSVGLTFDIGRMYIVRNESQSFCDSAAIAAAWQLDGSLAESRPRATPLWRQRSSTSSGPQPSTRPGLRSNSPKTPRLHGTRILRIRLTTSWRA